MTKIDIFPSFLASCSFQFEELSERMVLTFTLHPLGGRSGNTWTAEFDDFKKYAELTQLCKKIVGNKRANTSLILDGVGVKYSIVEDGIENEFQYQCPEPGTDELTLVIEVVNLAQKLNKKHDFINYLERLEGYFNLKRAFKITDTNPYTVRIYGSLSFNEKELICQMIKDVSQKPEAIIDMTNFEGMGMILFECFAPLAAMAHVTIQFAREAREDFRIKGFVDYMISVGFDSERIVVVY